MLYPEVVGYAFDTVHRHNSMALRNSGGSGGTTDSVNLGLGAMPSAPRISLLQKKFDVRPQRAEARRSGLGSC